MSNFGASRELIGNKDHICEWCGQAIPKGDNHYQFKGMWEGDWQNWRMHPECREYADYEGALMDGFTPRDNERPQLERKGE